jgi:ketosteroid isomerase-like protein
VTVTFAPFTSPAGDTSRAGVEAFNNALDSATLHMDNAAVLALWEDDGVSLLPSMEPVVGKKAIAAFFTATTARLAGARMQSFANHCSGVEISGPWACESCVEHRVVLLAGGRRLDGWGKVLFVLHRDSDGAWRIGREMWNQAAAPAGTGNAH